jgi:hypothetical protein
LQADENIPGRNLAMRTCLLICATFIFLLACPAAAGTETEYFAVFMEGQKAGHTTIARQVSGDKVTTTQSVTLTMSRADVPLSLNMIETAIETTQGKPLGFKVIQDLAAMATKIQGTINKQGLIQLQVISMGVVDESTMQWPEGAMMSEAIRLLQLKKGLKEGTTFTVKVFSPSMLSAVDTEISVGQKKNVDLLGRVVSLTEVTSAMKSPTGELLSVSTSYVDDDLKQQKIIAPVAGINVEMVACAKEFALSENDPVEFIHQTFVPSPVPLADAKSAESITYHLVPKKGGKLQIQPNANQTARPDGKGGVILTVRPVEPPTDVVFPYKGNDKRAMEALRPTRFLQSRDERIVALAKRAVGNTKDATLAAKKIEKFVGEYIEQMGLSVGYASAAEVAASRKGDCTEHAVLTAAMCRAVGIPAEVVMGVMYVEQFAGLADIFGGHAWTQVYLGDKWVGLDATRAPNGYDARHIALASGNGNLESFLELLSTIGNFKINDIKIKKSPPKPRS